MNDYKHIKVAAYAFAYTLENISVEDVQRGIDFYKQYCPLQKVYLESHRALVTIPREQMLKVKQVFVDNGIEVAGGITLTGKVGDTAKPALFDCYCFSDTAHRAQVISLLAYTASLFDELILDDYFFSSCRCKLCIEKKGKRSWAQFKTDQMSAFSVTAIAVVKKANPDCKFVIKYPNWYESYQECGYDPQRQRDIFDGIYTGTETRMASFNPQHLQRYGSYSLMRWLENTAPGKNGGGWIDQGGVQHNMNIWLEQANLTLLAKARELLLFNFETCCDTDAMPALGHNLLRMDKLLPQIGNPIGVSAYKPFNSQGEDHIVDYLGMCGIPFEFTPAFDFDAPVLFMGGTAACDPDVMEKLEKYVREGGVAIVTRCFAKACANRGLYDLSSVRFTDRHISGQHYHNTNFNNGDYMINTSPQKVSYEVMDYRNNATWADLELCVDHFGTPILTEEFYGDGTLHILNVPDNPADLYRIPAGAWYTIGKKFAMRGAQVFLAANPQVNLITYDNDVFAVYNYQEYPSPVELVLLGDEHAGFMNVESGEKYAEPIRVTPRPRRKGDCATFRDEMAERIYRLPWRNGLSVYRLIKA